MPYTGVKTRFFYNRNHFFLFSGRSFRSAEVQNLIIDCEYGELPKRYPPSHMFSIPAERRLLFYCPHGTILEPYIASPIPLMQGSFEACEVVTRGQYSFNYRLTPRDPFLGLGTTACRKTKAHTIYKSIIQADRLERRETGETRAANVYDILVPSCKVRLKKLLTEIELRFPHYRNIHCLFSRKIAGEKSDSYDPYTLPSRFVQGQLGHWELLEENDGDFTITEPWVFIEITDPNQS
ncbi:putative adhesin [Endozoicomonas lisbonensis]|uniref:Putative adhesin Stv domain-containing protein n=1 Tax=Endozoicomonas lisbonensis TaxID=3120522 RepID=A0ABV2SD96_9GAMM